MPPYTFIHSPSAKISANWDRMIFQLDFQVKDALIYYDDNFDIVILKYPLISILKYYNLLDMDLYSSLALIFCLSELSRLSLRGYSE